MSFNHYYGITSYGYGVLNDSFTFKNNGTSAVQIPTLQVGLPSSIASRAFGVVLSPSDQFSVSQATGNNGTSGFYNYQSEIDGSGKTLETYH